MATTTASGIPVHCAFDEIVDFASLVPNPRNPNTHPEKQLQLLAKIIQHQGWRAPITVSNRSGFIVRGHGRLMAAQLLGVDQVPVDRQDYASEAEEWADLIADNRIAELAEIDESRLKDLLDELKIEDLDIELTGFDEKELDKLVRKWAAAIALTEDEVPEPPEDPVTKPGDLWQLGSHRLLCGDSTKAEDVTRLLAGEVVNLCLTDPPYCVGYENIQRKPDEPTRKEMGDAYVDPVDPVALLKFIDLIPADVLVMTFPVNRHFHILSDATRAWDLLYDCIWVKHHFALNINRRYQSRHEPILIMRKKKHQSSGTWNVPSNQSTVFEFDKPAANKDHPTMKPLELWGLLVRYHSDEGQLVFDPFLGSGTSIVACEQLGRRCYGIEIEPRYCDVVIKRWEQLTGQQAVLLTA